MAVRSTMPSIAELFLELEDSNRPMRWRLTVAIRSAIADGRLSVGAPLPPSRTLASQLGCSRWVVVEAYEELTSEGLLVSRPGSGTVVTSLAITTPERRALELPPSEPRITFSAAFADLSAFPRAEWAKAAAHVMANASPRDLAYPVPDGAPQFRTALAQRLRRTRGVRADPPDVIACGGTVHAIGLLARALRREGHTSIAIEDPGWTRLCPPLEEAGLRIVPISVDEKGIRVKDLAERNDVRVVLTTPAHQFPLGVVMAPERRAELLHWAQARDGLIVEDDYDGEFRYDRHPVGTLQALDPEHVVYIGSTSKILSPALRLGWMVAPQRIGLAVSRIRASVDLGVSVLDQLAMAFLMDTGQLDRHLRRIRLDYGRKQQLLSDLVQHHLPGSTADGIAAGLHAVLQLPDGVDEHHVVSRAAERGVKVLGLSQYGHGSRNLPPALVLGYAGLTESAMREGVAILAEVISTGPSI